MKKNNVKLKVEYNISFSAKIIRIMKISVLLLFLGLFSTYATNSYSQATKLTLNMNNTTVESVLNRIEKDSEFKFLYNHQLVNVNRVVNIAVKNVQVDDLLKKLFAGTNVKFMVYDHQIILTSDNLAKESRSAGNMSQQENFTVIGKVIEKNGDPLPGVNVYDKSKPSKGVITSIDGSFSIDVSSADAILVFSFVGFETQEIHVSSRKVIDITLIESSIELSEVVSIGYGTQKKVNLTGAVGTIKVDELNSRPLTNTSVALQGKVSGVYVMQNSGQPGHDQGTIRIRGIGTLNNNNPLVLIDGVPGDMNDVNPLDIESISVLKDAAASSIYGNRAANGVILIVTKRGKDDKMQIEYSGYFGVQNTTYVPEVLNSTEHAELYNEAGVNSGGSPKYSDEEIAKFRAGDDPLYPNTNWQDVMYNPANIQNHYIRASGNSDVLSYSFSGGYMDQDGVLMGSSNKKYNFRSNIDSYYLKNKNLHIGINIAGIGTDRHESPRGTTATIRAINRGNPGEILQYPDGRYGAGYMGRDYATIKEGGDLNTLYKDFTGKAFANLEVIKDWHVEVNYAYDWKHTFYTKYYPDLSLYNHETNDYITYKSSVTKYNSESSYGILNFLSNYQFILSTNHTFKFLLGYSEETWRRDWSTGFRKNLLSNQPELGLGDASTQTNGGGADATALQSYFGRFNYNFKQKYLFEANIRHDGSSRFAEDQRWGTFPSFSTGWRVSEEGFLAGTEFLDNLKLRASWGQLGNQNINTYYAASDILSAGSNYNFNNALVPGVAVTTLTNKSTTWETTTQSDVGIDARFLNKIDFTFDYFNRITDDILMQVPIPITLGNLNRPFQNIGSMKNTGWEISLGYFDTFGSDFHFDATLNLSHVANEVTDLKGLGPIYGNKTILTEGEAYWSFYGYEAIGIFQSDDEIASSPSQNENPVPGDIKFKDLNGDGEITLDGDRKVIGTQIPDLLYSLQLNSSWKGFDLNLFFMGVQGISAYSSLELTSPFFNGASGAKWLLDRWTPDNPSTTNQRVFLDTRKPGIVSTYYLEDASYLRLKNIELGYNLPKRWLSSVGFSSIRVFANVQNAFTITNYKGFDPEKPPTNTRSDSHPQVRITSFGLSFRF